MLLGVEHFVISAGAYIELIAFYEPYPAHRWWTARDPRLTDGARLSFG